MLWGSTILSKAFFVVCVLLAVGIFLTTFFTIIYQRVWYDRVMRPRYNPAYEPSCVIIIPCKGKMTGLEKTIQAYLDMDYQKFEVIYTVESSTDPAVEIINEVIKHHPRASLCVAGLASSCAQKNWNMLAAIKQAKNPDAYVFADGDIIPGKTWLREMVLPLSTAKPCATTGFRWLMARKGGLAEHNHAFFNAFLYQLFSVASFVGNVGLWGGSMAIRRKDFEDLKVGQRWAETAVDDLSLAEIIMKNSRTSVLVPSCITMDDEPLTSLPASMRWIERQMMFLKMYHTHLWLVATPAIFFGLVAFAWPLVAILASVLIGRSFFACGGAGPVILVAVDLITTALLYPRLGRMRNFLQFLAIEPVVRWIQLYSLALTATTNTIKWSGVEYKVKVRSGKVVSLNRPDA